MTSLVFKMYLKVLIYNNLMKLFMRIRIKDTYHLVCKRGFVTSNNAMVQANVHPVFSMLRYIFMAMIEHR